jgi:hypothetical protein
MRHSGHLVIDAISCVVKVMIFTVSICKQATKETNSTHKHTHTHIHISMYTTHEHHIGSTHEALHYLTAVSTVSALNTITFYRKQHNTNYNTWTCCRLHGQCWVLAEGLRVPWLQRAAVTAVGPSAPSVPADTRVRQEETEGNIRRETCHTPWTNTSTSSR